MVESVQVSSWESKQLFSEMLLRGLHEGVPKSQSGMKDLYQVSLQFCAPEVWHRSCLFGWRVSVQGPTESLQTVLEGGIKQSPPHSRGVSGNVCRGGPLRFNWSQCLARNPGSFSKDCHLPARAENANLAETLGTMVWCFSPLQNHLWSQGIPYLNSLLWHWTSGQEVEKPEACGQ